MKEVKHNILFGIVKKDDGRLNFFVPVISLSSKNLWDTPDDTIPSYVPNNTNSQSIFLDQIDSFSNIIGSGISEVLPSEMDRELYEKAMEISASEVAKIKTVRSEFAEDIFDIVGGDYGDILIHILSITFPYVGELEDVLLHLISVATLTINCSNLMITRYTGNELSMYDILEKNELTDIQGFYDTVEDLIEPGESLDIFDSDICNINYHNQITTSEDNYNLLSRVYGDLISDSMIHGSTNLREDLDNYMNDRRHTIFNDIGVITALKTFDFVRKLLQEQRIKTFKTLDFNGLDEILDEFKPSKKELKNKPERRDNNIIQMIHDIAREEEVTNGRGRGFRR